jgi:hypothetical protein
MSFMGDCSMAWIAFALVLFLALMARRQCEDGFLAGTNFNVIGALALGLGLLVVIVTLTGSARWGLLAGVAGVAVGGYIFGMFFDQAGGSE